jgi:predicted nucleic acid-binding protein
MMTKSQTLKTFNLKILFFVSCICIGFSAFTKCDAQNIVGKWKGVSVKNYYSADYAKEIGKSMEEKFSKDVGNSEINYVADHSFIMTFSELNSSDETVMKGTWDVTGDQLKLTLEPKYNPKKITTTATFSISGNTMITTAIISPPSRIIKTVSTGTRL